MGIESLGEVGSGDRRRQSRRTLRLPVRVQGRYPDGSQLDEVASCEDASAGGVSVRLQSAVRKGQMLHLSLPLPAHFRQYDLTDHSYRVYALVRSVVPSGDEGARVGLLFYGRTPPTGETSLPSGLFLMEGDTPASVRRDHSVLLMLRLEAEHAPGGVERGERAVAECVRAWDARVRISSLPAMKGATVLVEDPGGHFRSRAEVRHITIGADGNPRLDIVFLDASAPSRLQTPAAV